MHGPLPPNRGAGRPQPIGVREGRRVSQIFVPRDFGLDEDMRGKAGQKTHLTYSLVDPAVASRKPRPKVVAAPPGATFLLVEVPRHLKGEWGRTETKRKSGKLGLLPPRLCVSPLISRIFCLVPKHMFGSPSSARTLPPPIARPPSNLVMSVGLHANPGPHPLISCMPSDIGCRN
jgi:hypothetical protein